MTDTPAGVIDISDSFRVIVVAAARDKGSEQHLPGNDNIQVSHRD
jgi:hypothetical protein